MTGCIASSQNIESQEERERIVKARVQIIRVTAVEDLHRLSSTDIGNIENRVLDPLIIDTHVTTETEVTVIEGITMSLSAVSMTIEGEETVVLDRKVQMLIDQVISKLTSSIKAIVGVEKVTETEVIGIVTTEENGETTTAVVVVTTDVEAIEILKITTKSTIAEAIAETETIITQKTMAKGWLA